MGSGKGNNKRVSNKGELTIKQKDAINRYKKAWEKGWPLEQIIISKKELKKTGDSVKVPSHILIIPSMRDKNAIDNNLDEYYLGADHVITKKEEIDYCLTEFMNDVITLILNMNKKYNSSDVKNRIIDNLSDSIDDKRIDVSYQLQIDHTNDFYQKANVELFLELSYGGSMIEKIKVPHIRITSETWTEDNEINQLLLQQGILKADVITGSIANLFSQALKKSMFTSYHILDQGK